MGVYKSVIVMFLFWSLQGLSWWDVGHEVVGEIAWRELDQKTRHEVEKRLEALRPIYEQGSSLAAVGKLPDHMRTGFKAFDAWHYIDMPYSEFGVVEKGAASINIVWALCEGVRNLNVSRYDRNTKNPFGFNPKPFEQAFMLAFFVHLVGDLHQPLHAITRYSPSQPEGDRGATNFLIKVQGKQTNLHALWDTGVGVFHNVHDVYSPLVSMSPQTSGIADGLMKEFPKSHFGKKIEEVVFREWAKESHELAKKHVYNLAEGGEPSESYVKQGQKIAKERVALAGYRLAYLLKQLLSDTGVVLAGC